MITDQSTATIGEDRGMPDQTFSLLMVAAGREPSDLVAVRRDQSGSEAVSAKDMADAVQCQSLDPIGVERCETAWGTPSVIG